MEGGNANGLWGSGVDSPKSGGKESGGRKSEVRRAQHQFEHKPPRPSSRGFINYSSAFSKPIPPSGNVIYIF